MLRTVATIDELVNAIHENNEVGNSEIVCQEGMQFVYSGEPISILKPLKLDGNHCAIIGKTGVCFSVHSGDVRIKGFKFYDYDTSIVVDGIGNTMENIKISQCGFYDVGKNAMEIVSTKSNSKISKLRIENNIFKGAEGADKGEKKGIKIFLSLGAGKSIDGKNVLDTELSDVVVTGNHTEGEHRISIQLCSAMSGSVLSKTNTSVVINPVVRNVQLHNNILHGGWDGSICIAAGMAKQKNALVENVEIYNNDIFFGLWGMVFFGAIVTEGLADSGSIRRISITNNKLVGNPQANPNFCGAVQHGITFVGAHTIPVPHVHCTNIGIEQIEMKQNTISKCDYGIFLMGEYLSLDAQDSSICDCYLKNVKITENRLWDVKDAFVFYGGYGEGQQIQQGEKDLSILESQTYLCKGNRIENLYCVKNHIKGNVYKYRIHAILANGRGSVSDNCILKSNISNNVFEETEGKIQVTDVLIDSGCSDLGGNVIDEHLRKLALEKDCSET